MNEKSKAAALLGRLGGKARAARHDPETLSEIAAKGGKARAAKYTTEELRMFAKNAGRKPWKITPAVRRRILARTAAGAKHEEVAKQFDVSLRAIGRLVAREKQTNPKER